MNKLSDLIQIWKDTENFVSGSVSADFSGISSDSRNLNADEKWVFFARKGNLFDGHQFVDQVLKMPQVVAVLVEKPFPQNKNSSKIIQVRDSRLAMAHAAKYLAGDPSKRLHCVAVTGTNGKTTTSFLIQHLLNSVGEDCAISGTIRSGFKAHQKNSQLTTPDFSELQEMLKEAKAAGAKAYAFEASSHALDQHRLSGIELDAAIFTNLSSEHLDYHKNMEAYYQAKKKLFSELLRSSSKPKPIAVCPMDKSYGSRLAKELHHEFSLDLYTWAFEEEAPIKPHLWVKSWKSHLDGTKILLEWNGQEFSLETSLVGKFNVENVAGVITYAMARSLSAESIKKALQSFPGVPGRLERVPGSKKVFVDYAHTPDALENILSTLRPLSDGKLFVVFGCGGDRDKTKRPLMAQVVELYSDQLVITSDNPRSENPQAIIEDMLLGLQRVKPVHIEVDRRKAISWAISQMAEKDVLVIAGKGHEKYQQIGNERLEFDDVQVAGEYLV